MAENKRRWGDRPSGDDDEAALAALLNESNARQEKKAQEQGKGRQQRPGNGRWDNKGGGGGRSSGDDRHGRPGDRNNNHYQRPNDRFGGKPIVEDDRDHRKDHKRRRRWNDRDPEGPERWGDSSRGDNASKPEEKPEKVKAEFGLSGALAQDTKTGNTRNGGKRLSVVVVMCSHGMPTSHISCANNLTFHKVTLKFSEPAEARIPNTRWRLYVFRKKSPDVKANGTKDDLIDTYHISKQSSYLFGRERDVADIPVDHPSLSKQHAVLQYRSLPTRSQEIGKPDKLQCKPYLMDLESTNGTFINGVRIDSARYYELRRGDVITLGASTREYVLLTEQSAKTGI